MCVLGGGGYFKLWFALLYDRSVSLHMYKQQHALNINILIINFIYFGQFALPFLLQTGMFLFF